MSNLPNLPCFTVIDPTTLTSLSNQVTAVAIVNDGSFKSQYNQQVSSEMKMIEGYNKKIKEHEIAIQNLEVDIHRAEQRLRDMEQGKIVWKINIGDMGMRHGSGRIACVKGLPDAISTHLGLKSTERVVSIEHAPEMQVMQY